MSERTYRFIGIDVSTKKIAIGIMAGREGDMIAYSWKEIEAPGRRMKDRFRGLAEGFRNALEELRPVDIAFVEDVTFTRARQSELGLAKVLGAVEAHLADCGIPYIEVNNATWRSALGLAGLVGATKRERKARSIAYARSELGVEAPNHDVGDALCVLRWGLVYRLADPKARELLGR